MRILSIGLRAFIGVIFTVQGIMKVAGVQNEWRDELQVAPWFWVLTGIIQLTGAIGLFASFRFQRLIAPGGLLFVVVMLGAIIQHIRIDDPVSHMIFPAVLLLLSGLIAAIGEQKSCKVASSTGEESQSVVSN